MRLIKAVGNVASQAGRNEDREVLIKHLNAIRDDAIAGLATDRERTDAETLYQEVRSAIVSRPL